MFTSDDANKTKARDGKHETTYTTTYDFKSILLDPGVDIAPDISWPN